LILVDQEVVFSSLSYATHVAVAQRIERPDDSEAGCGFESHQPLAHLEAPELVARGFFVCGVVTLSGLRISLWV